jgi:hypothetical protein
MDFSAMCKRCMYNTSEVLHGLCVSIVILYVSEHTQLILVCCHAFVVTGRFITGKCNS